MRRLLTLNRIKDRPTSPSCSCITASRPPAAQREHLVDHTRGQRSSPFFSLSSKYSPQKLNFQPARLKVFSPEVGQCFMSKRAAADCYNEETMKDATWGLFCAFSNLISWCSACHFFRFSFFILKESSFFMFFFFAMQCVGIIHNACMLLMCILAAAVCEALFTLYHSLQFDCEIGWNVVSWARHVLCDRAI